MFSYCFRDFYEIDDSGVAVDLKARGHRYAAMRTTGLPFVPPLLRSHIRSRPLEGVNYARDLCADFRLTITTGQIAELPPARA